MSDRGGDLSGGNKLYSGAKDGFDLERTDGGIFFPIV